MRLFARGGGSSGSVPLCLSPGATVAELRRAAADSTGCAHLEAAGHLRISHWGRPLHDDYPIGECLLDGATVDLQGMLRGGGGDGGSTGAESRSSYLAMYASKKLDKVDPAEERLASWLNCRLTGKPLNPPCCADRLGSVFNKDAVIEAILSKSLPKELSHITLKSVITLKMEKNPAFQKDSKSTANQGNFSLLTTAPFVCPVSGKEANGRSRFVVLRKCGTVVAEKAVKQFAEAVVEHVGYKWDAADVLPLNPPKEEVEVLRDALVQEHVAAKAKKEKKRKNKVASLGVQTTSGLAAAGTKGVSAVLEEVPHTEVHEAKKRYKASEHVPTNASSKIYASLFTSSQKGEVKETYMCRANAARGMNLT